VLSLAVYGTIELISPAGAGAGEGPQPIWKPAGTTTSSLTSWTPGTSNILQVQVIGQQWAFTYRYPQFGGFETTQLMLPVNRPVQFNVTSLDVIHSFWAYQLGVKADANPGVNNVAYTTPTHMGTVTVRCAELCGLWHGAMFDYGQVMTDSAFQAWATSTEAKLAAITAILPPYSTTYDPTVIAQINKAMAKAGIAGANGYYYPPNDPAQP
jgi:cytochrome c oxidase subunit 2